MRDIKVKAMETINELEDIILLIEDWKEGEILNTKFGLITTQQHKEEQIKNLQNHINITKQSVPDSDKLYLTQIIEKEQPIFTNNNLILAPVGSGKSYLITYLIEKYISKLSIPRELKIVILVSTTSLKDSVCPDDLVAREEIGHRMFTTGNKKRFGEVNYSIHVMSYQEFGKRILTDNDYALSLDLIFCDEIHSLPDYKKISRASGGSDALTHAIKYLFMKHDEHPIYYFTATNQKLIELGIQTPGIFKYVSTFDYREHKDIRKYIALLEYKINNIEQARVHLRASIKSFNYYGYKGLAFARTISGMKNIGEILTQEGFNPLLIWSINNTKYVMTEEQIKARDIVISTGQIPAPYNFLVINSSMQEGWNLTDDKVKLAIMNTTNETEHIQALGRLRSDICVLVCRTKDLLTRGSLNEDIIERYIDIELDINMKNTLCNELGLLDSKGRISKWRKVMELLIEKGYEVENQRVLKDGKKITVSVITE